MQVSFGCISVFLCVANQVGKYMYCQYAKVDNASNVANAANISKLVIAGSRLNNALSQENRNTKVFMGEH